MSETIETNTGAVTQAPAAHTAPMDTAAQAGAQGQPLADVAQAADVTSVQAAADVALNNAHWSDTARDLLIAGGPIVWLLTVLSVISLALILLKIWQFWSGQVERRDDVDQALGFWNQGNTERALSLLKTRRPASALVALAIRNLSAGQSEALVREEVERVAHQKMAQQRAWLRPIELIGGLSPLLGLLGTVIGMIMAFKQMEAAGSQVDPSVLSGGIWQALLTTAVGLVVAIPAVAAHTGLERKTERVAALMSDCVTQVFTRKPDGKVHLSEADKNAA